MSDWQRNTSQQECDDAILCGYYDLHLSALPVVLEADRVGNGQMFMVDDCGIAVKFMYEE